MKNRFTLLLTALMLCFTLQLNAQNKNAKPFVIPELREWTGTTGEFTITKSTKVLHDADLAAVAAQFAYDYEKMTGTSLEAKSGNAGKGAIILTIATHSSFSNA